MVEEAKRDPNYLTDIVRLSSMEALTLLPPCYAESRNVKKIWQAGRKAI